MKHATPPASSLLTLADIVGVYGIKGWVKLRVQLDEPQLLLSFQHLQLSGPRAAESNPPRKITVEALQQHGKGFIARLEALLIARKQSYSKASVFRCQRRIFPPLPKMRFIGGTYWV